MTPAAPDRPVRDHVIAALWGAAEATFLPIVPDVWLTRVAMRSRRRAYWASMSALGGALAGGALTYLWARRTDPATSRAALRSLPAISKHMIDRCDADVQRLGNRAMLTGPLRGVPYKLYGRAAGVQRSSPAGFLAWSVPARTPRFLLVSGATIGISSAVENRLGPDRAGRLTTPGHALFWVAFYAWYLRTVGRED